MLASIGILLRSCMEMLCVSDLGALLYVPSDLRTKHNHEWLFHIQSAYLNSLRERNEHRRVMSVSCDIMLCMLYMMKTC